MRCKSIEKKLVFYLEGDLSSAEHQFVSQHITHCSDCAAKLEYLRTSFQWLETEKATRIKPFLFTRIQARIESRQQTVRSWVLAPLAMASVLGVGLFLGSVVGKMTLSQPRTSDRVEYSVADLFDDAQMESAAYKLLND